MIKDETVKKLIQISTPKTFKANEYICYEGQPGEEMYIILRGTVGVYVTNPFSVQTEVARIMAGDFFGEMALFDNLPRSASCIALEDVICIVIGKDKVEQLFSLCPNMAMMMLENMSSRIRRLDNELYKNEKFLEKENPQQFKIPAEYSHSHNIDEPPHDLRYINTLSVKCPICGKPISIVSLKKQIMSMMKPGEDGRITYKECDPLWYDVWSCPYCHYSNYYLNFFCVLNFKKELISKTLSEQHNPELSKANFMKTPFDHLFLRYIQAIHINEITNRNDVVLLGKLWVNLYWLFTDAGDDSMRLYCAEKAIGLLEKAVKDNRIPDAYSKQSLTLTLASLYSLLNRKEDAMKMCDISSDGNDGELKTIAHRFKEKLLHNLHE